MSGGIELAGLVLATLPLCVEAGKAYYRGIDVLGNLVRHSHRDEKLSEFYEDFYWNINELEGYIQEISIIAAAGTSQPASIFDVNQWHAIPGVTEGLKRAFGDDAGYHQYIVTIERIARLLTLLLHNEPEYINRTSMNESKMFDTLRAFARDRAAHKTTSDFVERFRFFKGQKARDHCVNDLEKWNERLYRLVKKTRRPYSRTRIGAYSQTIASRPWNTLVLSIKSPSAHIRRLTKDLYTVLSNSWRCSCTDNHEARFCLNLHRTEKSFSDVEAEFSFVVSHSLDTRGNRWKEGTVGIRTANAPLGGVELRQVCDAVRTCMAAFRLRLLMEDVSGQHRLWKLDPRPRNLVLESEPASLQELLVGHAKMGPSEKRELAVICAYSLLLLHDTPWLSSGWDKSKLSFFFKPNHEPDFVRPFISTRFDAPERQIDSGGSGNVFHRNLHILALGILLIEIFNEKPVEYWRRPLEQATASADTDAMINWLVSLRIVEKMDPSPSTSAIEACLNLDWIPQGREVSLEDAEICNGLFTRVIQPLEAEIAMLS